MALWANLWRMAPYLAMGRPNWLRSLAYCTPPVSAPFGGTDHGTAELDAADVEDVDRDLEALFALIEQVLDRHLHVVEEDLAGR